MHYYYFLHQQHLLLHLRYIFRIARQNTGGQAEEKHHHEQRHGLKCEWGNNEDESDINILSNRPILHPTPPSTRQRSPSSTRKVLSQLKLAAPSLRICQPDVRLAQPPAVRRLRSVLIKRLSSEVIPYCLKVPIYSFDSLIYLSMANPIYPV